MKKENHPNYEKYETFIKEHKNYEDLPFKDIWVKTGKSKAGKSRREWWEKKRSELGLDRFETLAETCREIHPTKEHVCQVCGKSLSVYYIYPNKNSLKKINDIYEKYGVELIENEHETDIYEILSIFNELNLLNEFKQIFAINTIENDVEKIISEIDKLKITKHSNLSPGVMSNAPDRLDGFHSYNACCRPSEDKGRSKENLKKYGEDRRAYENWSSGNWKSASWLMKEIGRKSMICPQGCDSIAEKKMSADHIGPISLGFCHSPYFKPMCKGCNASKNNRITEEEILHLIELEKSGKEVISVHSKKCWNAVKHKKIDIEIKRNILKENLGNILYLFSKISDEGYFGYLLKFLNPHYSFYTYSYEKNISISELCSGKGIIEREIFRTENYNNCKRYIQKSFDSLASYQEKDNRKINFIIDEDEELKIKISALISSLNGYRKYKSQNEFLEFLIKILEDIKNENKNPIEFFEEYKKIGTEKVYDFKNFIFTTDENQKKCEESNSIADKLLDEIYDLLVKKLFIKYNLD